MADYNLNLPDNTAAPDWILNPNGTSGTNNSFNANTFNWGSAISGAGQGLGALFTGIGALIHSDPPQQNQQPYQTNQPNNNQNPNNQGGNNNSSSPISTTTVVIAVVLVVLVVIVIVLALKKTKST